MQSNSRRATQQSQKHRRNNDEEYDGYPVLVNAIHIMHNLAAPSIIEASSSFDSTPAHLTSSQRYTASSL